MPREADPEKVQKLVQAITSGSTIYDAMIGAGYAESVARQGRHGLPDAAKAELAKIELKRSQQIIELGKQVTPEMVQNAVKGRLMQNLIDGEDSAVQSAKALGSWREVDMFKSDIVGAGVIVLAAPNVIPSPKIINGEVIEVKELPALPENVDK